MRILMLTIAFVAMVPAVSVVYGASLFSSATELDLGRKFSVPDPAGDA